MQRVWGGQVTSGDTLTLAIILEPERLPLAGGKQKNVLIAVVLVILVGKYGCLFVVTQPDKKESGQYDE